MSLSLIDIPFTGSQFTWSNQQFDDNLIFEGLDRAYCIMDWKQLHDNSYLINFPILYLDYGPILLQI